MTTHFDEIEAYRSFSLISPKPVIFGEMCFWNGLFMSKRTAYTLCSKFFLMVPITPSMKCALWGHTYEVKSEIESSGYVLPFELDAYSPDRMIKYLYCEISKVCSPRTSPAFDDWRNDYRRCIEHFFVE